MDLKMSWPRIAGLVLHLMVGGLMIFAGSGKAFGFAPPQIREMLTKVGLGDKIVLIGAGEMIAALLMIIPWSASLGVLAVSGFWGGVICIHMSHGESYAIGIVAMFITWLGAFLRYPSMFASFHSGFRGTDPALD